MNTAKLAMVSALFIGSSIFLPWFGISQATAFEAITKPSADIALSFVQPGKIQAVAVKEGNVIKKGELIARQDDEIETIQQTILAAKAQNTTRIQIAEAELLQKEKDFRQMESALAKGATTDWEVEHARLDAETARLQLKLLQFEHDQDLLKEREIKAVVDRLRLMSPINGVVEEVHIEVGESVQAFSTVVRLVNINPLLVDVAVPVAEAQKLHPGLKAAITYADGAVTEGTIENIASVADAAASTRRVRVRGANPTNRPAGERVTVEFSGAAQ